MENASTIAQQALKQLTLITMEFAFKIYQKEKDLSNIDRCLQMTLTGDVLQMNITMGMNVSCAIQAVYLVKDLQQSNVLLAHINIPYL